MPPLFSSQTKGKNRLGIKPWLFYNIWFIYYHISSQYTLGRILMIEAMCLVTLNASFARNIYSKMPMAVTSSFENTGELFSLIAFHSTLSQQVTIVRHEVRRILLQWKLHCGISIIILIMSGPTTGGEPALRGRETRHTFTQPCHTTVKNTIS